MLFDGVYWDFDIKINTGGKKEQYVDFKIVHINFNFRNTYFYNDWFFRTISASSR